TKASDVTVNKEKNTYQSEDAKKRSDAAAKKVAEENAPKSEDKESEENEEKKEKKKEEVKVDSEEDSDSDYGSEEEEEKREDRELIQDTKEIRVSNEIKEIKPEDTKIIDTVAS